MRARRSHGVLGALTVIALLAAAGACVRDDEEVSSATGETSSSPARDLPAAVQELRIVGDEYSFVIEPDPASGLRPGWTRVSFDNTGDEAHQVMFARIKDGVDMADLAAAGAGDSSGAGAIEFVDMIGGVSYIGAGHDTTALVDLPEGIVMAMCYVPDADGVAHALMGMTTMLNVTADAPAPTESPATSDEPVLGTIELSEDGYAFPDTVRPGWYEVRNTDDALHELSLLRLDRPVDGEELDELVAELAANQVPSVGVEAVGGLGAISSGFGGYLELDLEPGEYLAVDFMPDPGEPRPHMLDGYHGRFSVPEG